MHSLVKGKNKEVYLGLGSGLENNCNMWKHILLWYVCVCVCVCIFCLPSCQFGIQFFISGAWYRNSLVEKYNSNIEQILEAMRGTLGKCPWDHRGCHYMQMHGILKAFRICGLQMWRHFRSALIHLFPLYIFLLFLLHCAACGILVLQPQMEPRPLGVKAWSPNHWTTREFPIFF